MPWWLTVCAVLFFIGLFVLWWSVRNESPLDEEEEAYWWWLIR